MADDQKQLSEAETEEHDDSERARLWDEAVGVKQDGKEPPQEEEKEPEVDGKEEESVEAESEPESEDSDDEEEDTEEEPESDDPWAGVPENLRKEFEDYKEKSAKYEHETRSQRGRVGALQKKVDDLSRKLEEATKKESPQGPAEAQDPGESLFKTPSWEKFREDFGDVATPIEDAIRLSYKDLHSRLQDTKKVSEELRSSDEQRRWEQEAVKLEREWPEWRNFIESNRDEFDSFVADNEVAGELLEPNKDNLTNASKAKALLVLFNDHLNAKNPKEKPASKEAKPKPEPRQLTAKQKAQLRSAATIAPRSAPGHGRRSDDLPPQDEFSESYRYFEAKAPTR